MVRKIILPSLRRVAIPIAIIVLPLCAFLADRIFGEYVTELTGLTLYTLYILGLIAYVAVSFGRSPGVLSVSAGVLGIGAMVSLLIGMLGIIAALFIFVLSLPWLGPPRPAFYRVAQFAVGLAMITVALSPWLISWALGKTSVLTLRFCVAHTRRASVMIGVAVGVCLTIAGMALVATADAKWLAQRQQAFETNEAHKWEQSLREIKANWLCGHRRCLMPVCFQLVRRFGQTTGECGPFACPFGFAIEAPNVPSDLTTPFQAVYGYPVKQVCAIGD